MTSRRGCAVLLALAIAASAPSPAAQKKHRRKPRGTPTPAVTPTPTPIPYFRAAGSCLRYEKDHFLVLAEVGQAGRVFHIDKSTTIAARITTGARLRVLYVDTPEGPLAKRILPGPVEVLPTPTPGR